MQVIIFPTLPVMHVSIFSSLTALLSLCILILIIISILALDDFLLDFLGGTLLVCLVVDFLFSILILLIMLTTSLLALCCTLLSSNSNFLSSSSSSSFRTGFLDTSGGGRGTKGSGSGGKFLDLIFQCAGGGCFAEGGSCCFVGGEG